MIIIAILMTINFGFFLLVGSFNVLVGMVQNTPLAFGLSVRTLRPWFSYSHENVAFCDFLCTEQ